MNPKAMILLGLLACLVRSPGVLARDYSASGKYPVGVRMVVLVDESRKDEYSGGPRTLVTELWYPAAEEARTGKKATFLGFFGKHQEAAGQFVRHFGGRIDEVEKRFRCRGVRDARLRKGRFPLLVFSHGNG